ncbi:50S ribosomal protein L19 [Candidatus Gracilibacteria bacterium]|nr:50S ribosomal protein L19 [Candidatus Gracilibacteria bacterium]
MSNLKIQALNKRLATKKLPTLRPGYLVRVHQKIKEGEKERVQIFEGIVMGLSSGNAVNKSVTVRKVVEGIGVEKIFPLASPNVVKIDIKKTFKVRRAKLGYMRDTANMSSRLKAKLGLIERDEKMNKGKGEEAEESKEEVKSVEEPAVEEVAKEEAATEETKA